MDTKTSATTTGLLDEPDYLALLEKCDDTIVESRQVLGGENAGQGESSLLHFMLSHHTVVAVFFGVNRERGAAVAAFKFTYLVALALQAGLSALMT